MMFPLRHAIAVIYEIHEFNDRKGESEGEEKKVGEGVGMFAANSSKGGLPCQALTHTLSIIHTWDCPTDQTKSQNLIT